MKITKKKPEVLAPAGNLQKFFACMHFGADAVYLAGRKYGLRTSTDNFDREQLKQAVEYAHSKSCKVYLTLNIVAHNSDFEQLPEYLQFVKSVGVDGLIISDPGVFAMSKIHANGVELHISTQANITNKYTAQMWIDMGCSRIIPARELSLKEIAELRQAIPSHIEIETFVHGAMCMAYSGRCLLSNYSSSRQSNKGACNHSCRWEYTVIDKKTGEQMNVEEDERGSYIFNSKDLNMIEHLDKLINAGVSSFKIEGRSKSIYYAGAVTNAYRRAVDFLFTNPGVKIESEIVQELNKVHSRGFCTGLYFGKNSSMDTNYDTANSVSDWDVVAIVLGDCIDGTVLLEHRNKFVKGDSIQVVSPNSYHNQNFVVEQMSDEDHNVIEVANKVQQKILLKCNLPLKKGDMLRKKI
ncbi:MAG: U32 family peptidase [Clostridiales bacterium]|jgi:putative protease|nr:U32 family peptidase [Clostridiales bacterium]